MDGQRFDTLARALATGMPRRTALRALVAGAAAAALPRPQPARAAPSGCRQFCGFFADLDPGECQGECARCEGRGGEFCGAGFHDRPFCCPPGEVCLQQKSCCRREQVCRYSGSIVDCCPSDRRCIVNQDGEGTCQPA